MLTAPDNLVILHLLDDDLQDELLHHLSQDGVEADRPVVSWVLLQQGFREYKEESAIKRK